ncbi:MAG: hypothetical protein AB1733_10480 [Thermodesulfobacteriota bacterium]
MKCQSDFEPKEQEILRQADECVEEWWEPGAEGKVPPQQKAEDAETSDIATREALRRGLVKEDQTGDLCLACPEEEAPEGSKD